MVYNNSGKAGIFAGQSMFEDDGTGSGIADARSSFVRMLNIIFARTAVVVDRPQTVEALTRETPLDTYLLWRQGVGSRQVETIPPKTLWDEHVYTPEERDALLINPTFIQAQTNGAKSHVLVDGLGNQDAPQWNVWACVRTDTAENSIENLDYDVHVYSMEERDALFEDSDFLGKLYSDHTLIVLVDEIASDDPKWSTWTAHESGGFTALETYDYATTTPTFGFTATKSYDFEVDTLNDRDLLLLSVTPPVAGQLVLVKSDVLTDGFWSIWKYLGMGGWKLVRYQTYRTTDFWSYADWYADGYSATKPPVVRYPNQAARDFVENPNPKTTFVRLDDDGTGSWVWTAYVGGFWTIVARQNGTIQLSPKLYETDRKGIGFDPLQTTDLIDYANNVSNVPARDGGWELRVMIDALRDAYCLTDLEINELFFSMLHFVHAQQDQVSWAFKTSFMNLGGYNEALKAVPVQPVDNTQNLLNYIDEVQPYRVKTRQFTRIVTPERDDAITRVTDFDFPMYYDAVRGVNRWLDINNAADLAIIQTQRPWSDWYENYQKTGYDVSTYDPETWNPTRRFKIGIHFDRVDHMALLVSERYTYTAPSSARFSVDADTTGKIVDVRVNTRQLYPSEFTYSGKSVSLNHPPEDGDIVLIDVREGLTPDLAADRINRFYSPSNSDAEKNVRDLMGLNYKINSLEGGEMNQTLFDYSIDSDNATSNDEAINPNQKYFGLADPGKDKDRPEELVVMKTSESVNFKINDTVNAVSWRVAMSLPSFDALAPIQIGDYDARPMDDVPYDTGYVGDVSMSPLGEERPIYVIRPEGWQYVQVLAPVGVLMNDLLNDDLQITISGNGAGLVPPTKEDIVTEDGTTTEITHPGVVWINGERIEFFDYTPGSTTTVISEIRRGTNSTRIGQEQIVRTDPVANSASRGDSVRTVFTLVGATDLSKLTVSAFETLRYPTGEILTSDGYTGYPMLVQKTLGTDYSAKVVSGNIEVTFVKPPASGSYIYITMAKGVYHPAGSEVRDGSTMCETRPDDNGGAAHYGPA